MADTPSKHVCSGPKPPSSAWRANGLGSKAERRLSQFLGQHRSVSSRPQLNTPPHSFSLRPSWPQEKENGCFTVSRGHQRAAGRNAGQQVGAKRALKVRQIWAIRFFLNREVVRGIEHCATWPAVDLVEMSLDARYYCIGDRPRRGRQAGVGETRRLANRRACGLS